MKDRYLCRGKRIDNGEWVEGFYFCMTHPDARHTHHFIIPLGADLSLGTPIERIQVEVDPSTICRCTGLKDKNAELIWENDIVRHYNNPSKPDTYDVGLILFQDHSPGFERTSRMHDDNVGICMDCVYEVIGNVFDNPELLVDWSGEE